jgi:hypothetical protein
VVATAAGEEAGELVALVPESWWRWLRLDRLN